jgi:hypothetical protein
VDKKAIRRIAVGIVLFIIARAVLHGSGFDHSILMTLAMMGFLYGMSLGFRILLAL